MNKKSYLNNPGALKIDLMLRGVIIEDPVLMAEVCGRSGVDLMLPGRTPANVDCSGPYVQRSPYRVIREEGKYYITDGTGRVPVTLIGRPAYYNKKTSTGVRLSDIASTHGSYTVITPDPGCGFFKSERECRYCSGNFDTESGRVYTIEEVLETVREVLKEKLSPIIYLSMGFTEGPDGGIEFLGPYVKAIKKHFNCLVAVEALPPKNNRWIDRTYALGADSLIYNLEIFDPELFALICPGRAELTGRKRYLDALEYAARIFPGGTVASHLIVGLEPPGSTIKGIDYLTERGIVPILPIYRPRAGSGIEVNDLTAEVVIPVYRHLYRALKLRRINFNWVRDISMVTTPVEARRLVDGDHGSLFENFYRTRLGLKTAWGLSTLRRKLRVREVAEGPKEVPKKS